MFGHLPSGIKKGPFRDELLSLVKEGWSVDKGNGGHLRLTHPKTPMPVFASFTPSDPKVGLYLRRDCKNALKKNSLSTVRMPESQNSDQHIEDILRQSKRELKRASLPKTIGLDPKPAQEKPKSTKKHIPKDVKEKPVIYDKYARKLSQKSKDVRSVVSKVDGLELEDLLIKLMEGRLENFEVTQDMVGSHIYLENGKLLVVKPVINPSLTDLKTEEKASGTSGDQNFEDDFSKVLALVGETFQIHHMMKILTSEKFGYPKTEKIRIRVFRQVANLCVLGTLTKSGSGNSTLYSKVKSLP